MKIVTFFLATRLESMHDFCYVLLPFSSKEQIAVHEYRSRR